MICRSARPATGVSRAPTRTAGAVALVRRGKAQPASKPSPNRPGRRTSTRSVDRARFLELGDPLPGDPALEQDLLGVLARLGPLAELRRRLVELHRVGDDLERGP